MFDYPDHTKNRISPSAGSTTVHIAQILKGKDTKNAKYGSKRKREYNSEIDQSNVQLNLSSIGQISI